MLILNGRVILLHALSFRCLIQCKCDKTLRDYSLNITEQKIDNLDGLEFNVQDQLKYFNLDRAREALFEAKDKYIELRREERTLKKYEAKFKRLQQLNQTATELIKKTIIDYEHCDMNCGINCIRPKLEFPSIVLCLNQQCSCQLISNPDEIIDRYENRVVDAEPYLIEDQFEGEVDKTNDIYNISKPTTLFQSICNYTCLEECDSIRQFLEEDSYKYCIQKDCDCDYEQQILVQSQNQENLVEGFSPQNQKIFLMLTFLTIIISLAIGVSITYKPLKQRLQVPKLVNKLTSLPNKVKANIDKKNADKFKPCKNNSTSKVK
ncbi:UNKNOWN [Stylonychia lemnae]|uniref:Transmembrane protein n=1 Tax=Stylonychia lemnae TaxID=5949 RepID=A0A078A2Y7_STYLE|nr:UNKNOWN [Stylonychia lemnae]|eukprot:CDW76192.1 UNKNOWN [Stylonychia lemnae]